MHVVYWRFVGTGIDDDTQYLVDIYRRMKCTFFDRFVIVQLIYWKTCLL